MADVFSLQSSGADVLDLDDSGNLTVTGDVTTSVGAINAYIPREIADPGASGAVPITASGVCHLVTAGAETRTVADPTRVGLQLTLVFLTDGGDCVLTFASPVNEANNNTLTFGNAGAAAHFVSARDGASAYYWQVVGTNFDTGDAFSTV